VPKRLKPADYIGVNVQVPPDIHRAAKLACVDSRITWDQAVAEALDAWARERGRKPGKGAAQ
jgi:hypothetical protein